MTRPRTSARQQGQLKRPRAAAVAEGVNRAALVGIPTPAPRSLAMVAGPSTCAIRATTDVILTRWWSVEAVAHPRNT
jgi:ribulose kinase